MKIIEIVVSPQGETAVQTRGFVGSECQKASKWIEQSLGSKVSEIKTAEFYGATSEQKNEAKA